MFTNNWYKIIASAVLGLPKAVGVSAVDYEGVTRTLYGYSTKMSNGMDLGNGLDVRTSLNGATNAVCFGDGTTPATKGDYNLSGNLITTISATKTQTTASDDAGATRSIVYTVTNTGSEDITISEIGLFRYWYYDNSSNYTTFMVERTLLDKPITIAAGGVGQVTYTIRMNYPTA